MNSQLDLHQYLVDEYNLYKNKCLALNLKVNPLIYENYKYEVNEENEVILLGFVDKNLIDKNWIVDEVFDVFDINFKSLKIKSFDSIIINHPIIFGKKASFFGVDINYVEMNKVEYITLPLFYNSGIKEFCSNSIRALGTSVFEDSKLEKISAPNLKMLGNNTFKNSIIKSVNFPNLSDISMHSFDMCKNLEKVMISDDCNLSAFSFCGCKCLFEFNGFKNISICPSHCFAFSGIKEIDLRNVKVLEKSAFIGSKLKKIKLSNSLEVVEDSVFEDVNNLEIDFYGSEEEFHKIKVFNFNKSFINAKINFLI